MTFIDKAKKALERIRAHPAQVRVSGRAEFGLEPWPTCGEIATQALSDLSSLKLEDGDVEKIARLVDPSIWATRDYLASLNEPIMAHVDRACEPSRAKARSILSALGHGGEG